MKLYLLFPPLVLAIFFNAENVKDSNQLKFQSGPAISSNFKAARPPKSLNK